jgi:hypothetical protein
MRMRMATWLAFGIGTLTLLAAVVFALAQAM